MPDNRDANDEFQQIGSEAIADALKQARSALPPIPPYEGEGEPEPDDSTFDLLDIPGMESLPPPSWLIHEAVSDEGLTILYGEPGAGKSFVMLDMCIRVASGWDWFGRKTKQTGVIYVAAEGARGLGKRITGWKVHHQQRLEGLPFMVLPVAVQILDDKERAKLIRTLQMAVNSMGCAVGLIVIDTVSRSIAGIDENSQDTMTRFVQACDEVKRSVGGALIGVHHSGKDKERGMRGSSVLLGAVDASIRIEKKEKLATIRFEKQKDAEEAPPFYIELETVRWLPHDDATIHDELSTLVPVAAQKPKDGTDAINMDQIRRAFGMFADAWLEGQPLSNAPQTRPHGRYAPAIFTAQLGGDFAAWQSLIQTWIDAGNLTFEKCDKKNNISGLRVKDAIT